VKTLLGVVAASLIATSPAIAIDFDFDDPGGFRGVKWGDSLETARVALSGLTPGGQRRPVGPNILPDHLCRVTDDGSRVCSEVLEFTRASPAGSDLMYGALQLDLRWRFSPSVGLVSVTARIHPEDFSRLQSIFWQRFGIPRAYDRYGSVWVGPKTRISLSKFSYWLDIESVTTAVGVPGLDEADVGAEKLR
jgi:hypothetical protein